MWDHSWVSIGLSCNSHFHPKLEIPANPAPHPSTRKLSAALERPRKKNKTKAMQLSASVTLL